MARFHVFRVCEREVDPNDLMAAQMSPGFYWQLTTPADQSESPDSDVCHGPYASETLATFAGQDFGHERWA